MCTFKLELVENTDLHESQENAFLPRCVCMCFFKLEWWENAYPQFLQENACSSVCVSILLSIQNYVKMLIGSIKESCLSSESLFPRVSLKYKFTVILIKSILSKISCELLIFISTIFHVLYVCEHVFIFKILLPQS